MRCDVGDPKAVDALVAETIRRLGAIDVLVNNAGIYGPMGAIDEVDWQDWVQAININLMGTVYPCRAVVPGMKARGKGKIINLSGGGATNPLPGISAYAASKAASVRFTETLALELKPFGIDVNAVAPGALATRMMDQLLEAKPSVAGEAFLVRMQKLKDGGGTPLSVGARCCVWLASGASDEITGKLVAAQWDPYETFPAHAADLEGDIYTLRRIVPKDRGKDWGND
jgi:3-oxoacyl-[acyl-carrier protein] reductase